MRSFSARKRQHISVSLSEESQAKSLSQWSRVRLAHEAVPDFDLKDVDSSRELWGRRLPFPFFVSSMT
ncbi:MAG: hypothetical protein WCH11_04680, partial [Bdellovibrio sp.]